MAREPLASNEQAASAGHSGRKNKRIRRVRGNGAQAGQSTGLATSRPPSNLLPCGLAKRPRGPPCDRTTGLPLGPQPFMERVHKLPRMGAASAISLPAARRARSDRRAESQPSSRRKKRGALPPGARGPRIDQTRADNDPHWAWPWP